MVLTLHVFGAFFTAMIVVAAIISLVLSKKAGRFLSYLGVLTVFQLVSGILLVVVDQTVSITRICISSVIYLAVVGGVVLAIRRQTTLVRSRTSERS